VFTDFKLNCYFRVENTCFSRVFIAIILSNSISWLVPGQNGGVKLTLTAEVTGLKR
jgi:hypothetical protein